MPQASGNAMPVVLSGSFLIKRGLNATQLQLLRCCAWPEIGQGHRASLRAEL
jgi:hypothetical protein